MRIEDDVVYDVLDYSEENIEKRYYLLDRFCPVYNRVIGSGLCTDTSFCFLGQLKINSVPELEVVSDLEKAKEKCNMCFYTNT